MQAEEADEQAAVTRVRKLWDSSNRLSEHMIPKATQSSILHQWNVLSALTRTAGGRKFALFDDMCLVCMELERGADTELLPMTTSIRVSFKVSPESWWGYAFREDWWGKQLHVGVKSGAQHLPGADVSYLAPGNEAYVRFACPTRYSYPEGSLSVGISVSPDAELQARGGASEVWESNDAGGFNAVLVFGTGNIKQHDADGVTRVVAYVELPVALPEAQRRWVQWLTAKRQRGYLPC